MAVSSSALLCHRSDNFTPETVRFSAPARRAARVVAGKSLATVIVVVSARDDEQQQFTQSLLTRGYRLQFQGAASNANADASPALREIHSLLRGRFGGNSQLAVLQAEGGQEATVSQPREQLNLNGLSLDPRRREVRLAGTLIDLTKTEFDILYLLAADPEVVYTRNEILNAIKGDGYPVTPRSVDVQLVSLRRKLGPCGKQLQTTRGVGYRFVAATNL